MIDALGSVGLLSVGAFIALFFVGVYVVINALFGRINPKLSEKEKNKIIDRLQKQGFMVYQVTVGRDDGMTFEQARDAAQLMRVGCLVFSDHRGLEGYLYRARLTSDENAKIRRSQFKLVASDKPE